MAQALGSLPEATGGRAHAMSKSKVAPSEQLSMVIDRTGTYRILGPKVAPAPKAPEALRPDPFFLNLPKLNGPHPRLQECSSPES